MTDHAQHDDAAPGGPWTIGLDLGGTKCVGVLLDESACVREVSQVPTPQRTEAFVDVLVGVADDLRGRSPVLVGGIGIGVPGLLSHDGLLRYAPHLPGIVEFDLLRALTERLAHNVVLENDNTSATWAEFDARRRTENPRSLLYVGLGTGIGGALVTDGRLVRGTQGFAGEIGHMVVAMDGPACVCGRRGCWELFASGRALADLMRVADLSIDGRPARDGADLRVLLDRGSSAAESIANRFARQVAVGIVNLVLALDVDHVVIGGGVIGDAAAAGADAPLLSRVRQAIVSEFGDAAEHRALPKVSAAAHGPLSGAIGAALLARPTTHEDRR